ncbi:MULTISPECIES: hypothetical protein [unclassified Microcoleus]|uniref:hypothetical protein n=1 Tax=unclassified Microcoleus TaxID=2642155 RepID=UPI002FD42ADB
MYARLVSLFQLYPEHLALGCSSFPNSSRTSIFDVFAVCRFSDRLPSETSISGKPLSIMQNRKLLQHKFSAICQICGMMATDALEAIGNCSKSRHLTKSVSGEAKQ